jgi:RNA polymerase sigma factor (TIGR02999 family)
MASAATSCRRIGSSCAGPNVTSVGDLSPDELYAMLYEELKRMAHSHLRTDGRPTLSTTELVHEAYLKIGSGPTAGWDGRAHFFGAASRAMREVLVDFARRRQAAKRGGDRRRVSLGQAEATLDMEIGEILALDSALDQLSVVNDRLRQVVELRFFGGLGENDVAEVLGVTPRTVQRDWVKAKLFLLKELDEN